MDENSRKIGSTRGCATKRRTSTTPASPRASCRNCRRARAPLGSVRRFCSAVTLVASVVAYFLSGGGWFIAEEACTSSSAMTAGAPIDVWRDRRGDIHRRRLLIGRRSGESRPCRRRAAVCARLRIPTGRRFARLRYVPRDLRLQRLDVLEFLLRPQIAQESHFDFFAVDVAVQIEEVQFEQPLRRFRRSTVGRKPRFATPRYRLHPRASPPRHRRRSGGNCSLCALRFAVGKSELAAQLFARLHRPENRVFAAEHLRRLCADSRRRRRGEWPCC